MEFQKLSCLLILLIYLVIPVVLSIQKKVRFVFQLRYLLPASIFSGAIFAMWDMRFIELGIWSFNSDYITGIEIAKVPIEEWLSFLIIPLSSLYIYEWLKIKFDNFEKANTFVFLSLVLFLISAALAYSFRKSMFTFFTFFLNAIYLGYTVFRNRFKKHFTKFYLTFAIALVPFILVSAIHNTLPAVIFNAKHIIGVGMFGVPIEKMGYLFLMLLINVTIYEYLSERQYY